MTPPEADEGAGEPPVQADEGRTPGGSDPAPAPAASASTRTRQPIVSVLGHVDHGKTTLLDRIRGSTVAEREAGKITQHIGATEVPLDTIERICGGLLGERRFGVPGLLFIDTPGHHAFTTLRARGGSLADLAILVVDINEGFMPQTREAVKILRRFGTPFIVAANKIDRLVQWQTEDDRPFLASYRAQTERAQQALDEGLYELIGTLTSMGFAAADRYDRVKNFQKTIGIVPVSAETGEGVPDLLMVLVGLAQRFLEEEIQTAEGPGEGTVLEVKEERGLGTTLDVIVHDGVLRVGDEVVVGGLTRPVVTRVRALLKPRPLDEIRDPSQRFDQVGEVRAAAGIKVSAPDLDDVVAGAPLRAVAPGEATDEVVAEVAEEFKLRVDTVETGLVAKADTLGSLEALVHELDAAGVPVSLVGVGPVTRRDVVEAATISEPLQRLVVGFNVPVLDDAKDEASSADVPILESPVIYQLLDDLDAWRDERKRALEAARRGELVHPGKVLILDDHTFRVSKPAIVGVRVLGGRVRPGQRLLLPDGRVVGPVRSIRSGDRSLEEARAGEEVAIAIAGVTVGRQVDEGDALYVDIPEGDARALRDADIGDDERQVLEETAEVHRRKEPFWGM